MRKSFDRTIDVTNYRYARNNMYPADDPFSVEVVIVINFLIQYGIIKACYA